jgi:hypothetical protein
MLCTFMAGQKGVLKAETLGMESWQDGTWAPRKAGFDHDAAHCILSTGEKNKLHLHVPEDQWIHAGCSLNRTLHQPRLLDWCSLSAMREREKLH